MITINWPEKDIKHPLSSLSNGQTFAWSGFLYIKVFSDDIAEMNRSSKTYAVKLSDPSGKIVYLSGDLPVTPVDIEISII